MKKLLIIFGLIFTVKTVGATTPTLINSAITGVNPASYASLAVAVSSIGTTKTTLVITSTQTLTSNLVIPSNITLKIMPGGYISNTASKTLTINGRFDAPPQEVFTNYLATNVIFAEDSFEKSYPQWFGAQGNGTTDCSAAFNAAYRSLPLGKTIYMVNPAVSYLITSSITLGAVNRYTWEGQNASETSIVWSPSASSMTLFYDAGGTLDTVAYKNFSITQGSTHTRVGCTAFLHAVGSHTGEWDHIFVNRLTKAGMNFGAGTYGWKIHDCQFLNLRDNTNANVATGIKTDGFNATQIVRNQFSGCDQDISVPGGSAILWANNRHEVGGDGGGVNIQDTVSFTATKGLEGSNNYFEGNINPVGGANIRLHQTNNTEIFGNIFAGQDGSTYNSYQFINVTGGASSVNTNIYGNTFTNPKTRFMTIDGLTTIGPNTFKVNDLLISSATGAISLITNTSTITYTGFFGIQSSPLQSSFQLRNSSGPANITGDNVSYVVGWSSINYITDGFTLNSTSTTVTMAIAGYYDFCVELTLEQILVTHNNFDLKLNTTLFQFDELQGGLLARNDMTMGKCWSNVYIPANGTASVSVTADSGTHTIDIIADGRYNVFSGRLR